MVPWIMVLLMGLWIWRNKQKQRHNSIYRNFHYNEDQFAKYGSIGLLYNNTAGNKNAWLLAYQISKRIKNTTYIDSRRIAEGWDALIVVGGDGTIHDAINKLTKPETHIYVVPAGTSNAIATSLGIRDYYDAFCGKVKYIRPLEANGKQCVLSVSSGFIADHDYYSDIVFRSWTRLRMFLADVYVVLFSKECDFQISWGNLQFHDSYFLFHVTKMPFVTSTLIANKHQLPDKDDFSVIYIDKRPANILKDFLQLSHFQSLEALSHCHVLKSQDSITVISGKRCQWSLDGNVEELSCVVIGLSNKRFAFVCP